MKLDPVERAEVAEDALQSLDHSDYWAAEPGLEGRNSAAPSHAEEHPEDLIPSEDVFREIEAELRACRGQR